MNAAMTRIENADIAVLVMSIQRAEMNKTVRYLKRNNITDYYVMIPSSAGRELIDSYGDRAVVYDAEKVKERIDFCGTDIKSGACVGQLACNDWLRERTDYKLAVVLDDDYGGVVCDYTTTPTLNSMTFYEVVKAVYKLGKDLGVVLGGYFGGAYPATKKNIMNVWLIDDRVDDVGLNKVLNEDVFWSIKSWQRGVANFGLGKVIRSGAQTAEMDKIDGNTKFIYATDRSYRKSFGAILADPRNSKLTYNRGNTKRGALWHHHVSWSAIAPKIILEET